jgi:hypothetical protein
MNFDKKKNLFWSFYSYEMPSVLVWLALVFLAIASYREFLNKGDFLSVITLYITIIAIVIALASVTFTFSKTTKDREFLSSVGELFLYSALALISSLLISWLSFEVKNFLQNSPLYRYYSYILILIFSWGQSFLLFAANSLHKALVDLEKYLWFRVKEKIK